MINLHYICIVHTHTHTLIFLNLFFFIEILDLVFWMRKYSLLGVKPKISLTSHNIICTKLINYIETKSYNFRNVVNLLFDLSISHLYEDKVI